MQTFSAGAITITKVVESEILTNPRFLYPKIEPADIAPHSEKLVPGFYLPDEFRFRMAIQGFVVRTPHHTLIVDTCVGNHKRRSNPFWNLLETPYLERLAAAGVAPEEVDFVMCTHLHVDHVGWNTRLVDGRWVPTFPNARYVFNRTEYEFWSQQRSRDQDESFSDSILPVMESGKGVLVDGRHEVTEGVVLEPTPGHTPGHCSVRLFQGGGEAVITGDLMHHPLQMLEPGRNSSFCENPAQAARTRRAFLERHAERDVQVIGTHFSAPTGGRVQGYREGFWLEP